MRPHRNTLNAAVGGAAALLLTVGLSPAFAQHELDASLEVGSGGINQPVPQPDFAARNQLLHGNIAGLGFFRDDIGHRAPGDFRDQLGSEDLFRFQALTTPVSPGAPPQAVQRPFTAAPMRAPEPAGPGLTAPAPLTGTRPLDRFDHTPGVTPALPDRGRLDDRRLFGQDQAALDARIGQPGLEPDEDELVPDPLWERQPRAAIEAPRLGEPLAADRDDIDITRRAGIILGQQLVQQPRDTRLEADSDLTVEETLERIRTAMLGRMGEFQAQPGDDVYADLLARIEQRDRILRGERPQRPRHEDRIAARPEDPADQQAREDDPDALIPPQLRLPEPTEQELAEAERQRIRAARRALGLPVDEPEADPQQPQDRRAEERLARAGVPHIVDVIDYDMPAIRSLVGRRNDGFNRAMARGERLLAEGNYFRAEQVYQSVIDQVDDNPLPRVGLIHAQLGAGLVRSGARNLRQLFTEHPELIAARYQAALLPGEDRLEWLQRQLQRMIGENESAEAALILAYLGHQAGSRPLVQYGLDRAGQFTPDDPLLPLLRRLWLESDAAPDEED